MKRAMNLTLAAMLTLTLVSTAKATTVWIDFGINTQETATTGWNNVSGIAASGAIPAGPISLVDSLGNATAIDISFTPTGSTGVAGTGANYAGPYPAEVSGFPVSAVRDSVYVGSGGAAGTLTAVLSMLNPTSSYDFLFYGAAGNIGDTATWTVTGLNFGNDTIITTLNNSTEVAIVNGIFPSALGEISILMTKPDGDLGRWNVLQLTEAAVPEPATGSALGLGSLLLLGVARRKRSRAQRLR